MNDGAHLETGVWGEDVAAAYLKRKKLKIIGRRVRVGARDEIDIIARDGGILVFVEVKTRKSERFGRPYDAVKSSKRRVMSRAAVRYISRLRKKDVSFRFDVVEVIGATGDNDPVVRHVENAFQLDRRYSLPY